MGEIPEDVMEEAAGVLVDAIRASRAHTAKDGIMVVAAAILAERKRCAEVARNYGTAPGLPDGKSGAFRKHRHAIADRIESGQ